MRLLGLDPGLRHTGWGVIDVAGSRLSYVSAGVAHSNAKAPLAERLVSLFRQLNDVIDRYAPAEAAVEETFVNKNPASTLKLGVARGVVLLAPAERGIPVAEYSANLIKKSVVGAGHADKVQVGMMVRRLLPNCDLEESRADAADALAVAICHAHHAATRRVWEGGRLPQQHGNFLSPRGEGGARVSGKVRGLGALSADVDPPHPVPLPERTGRAPRGESDLARLAKRKPSPDQTAFARQNQTDCEALLWRHLRAHQLDGVKFRRQEPILGFVADFVSHEHQLIVELDGGQHANSAADERRSKVLAQAGFRILRFWNNDVIENIEGVLAAIDAALAEGRP
ncbi:MAG TPA: crossover junction endodeoxyribonuclease RuvC [Stellaceae bacterium]